jgi:hypothetical protein
MTTVGSRDEPKSAGQSDDVTVGENREGEGKGDRPAQITSLFMIEVIILCHGANVKGL